MKRIKLWHILPVLFMLGIMAFKLQPKPTLYIIGDSTVRNGRLPGCGWGEVIAELLDTNRISVQNRAVGGRSTRTFLAEGHWDRVLTVIKPGDFLVMQFGHNEGLDTNRNVGVLPGTGDEQIAITRNGRKLEIRTYGWYLKKFVTEAKAKGAIVTVASMIPRSDFSDGQRVDRNTNTFAKWAREVAQVNNAYFVDLNSITADKYDKIGSVKTKELFYRDHTHTNVEGAKINAQSFAEGLRVTPGNPLNKYVK